MKPLMPDAPMSKLMRVWISRRMVIIAGVALAGIALHLILRYGIHSEIRTYQIPLWIVLAFGGIPLLYELLIKAIKLQFGSDLLAGISIVTDFGPATGAAPSVPTATIPNLSQVEFGS